MLSREDCCIVRKMSDPLHWENYLFKYQKCTSYAYGLHLWKSNLNILINLHETEIGLNEGRLFGSNAALPNRSEYTGWCFQLSLFYIFIFLQNKEQFLGGGKGHMRSRREFCPDQLTVSWGRKPLHSWWKYFVISIPSILINLVIRLTVFKIKTLNI